jgi:hypothetical protein
MQNLDTPSEGVVNLPAVVLESPHEHADRRRAIL